MKVNPIARAGSTLLLAVCLTGVPAKAQESTISLHSDNARVRFKIGHIFSAVNGSFSSFRGQIKLDPKHPENGSVSWDVNVHSVDTENSTRDAHLLKEEYFNADTYPKISFVSQSVRKVDSNHLEVTGQFTLRGVTKTIQVPVVLDENGLECEFTIHRSEYGLSAGKPAVHENVEIDLTVTDKKLPAQF